MFFRLRVPLITLAVLFVCLSVHELGHAAAGYLTGGRITAIVLLSLRPQVRIAGSGTAAIEAFRAVAGSACYLLFYSILALICPRSREEWRAVSYAASLFAAVEVLGWTLSSLAGTASMGPNDAEDFIAVSQANRYLVAAVAACIGVAGATALRWLNRRRTSSLPQSSATPVHPLAKSAAGGA